MERQIGDKFKLNGCVYVVVEDNRFALKYACEECAFSPEFCSRIIKIRGCCTENEREDMKNVHFEHFGVNF